jgi:signal transduction histidine kinase
MNPPVRLRMTEFLFAIAAVVAVIVFTERSAWQQISRLRKDVQPETVARIRSADRLNVAILELREASRLASGKSDAANRASLQHAGARLETLLGQELQNAPPSERKLLQEISAEFQTFRAEAKPEGGETRVSRMLALCEELRVANEAAAKKILEEADAGLTRLQRFLFVSLLGLLICGAVVLVLTYRRMVRPLHSSLAESRIMIERQEKLASLGVFATGIAHEIRNPITAIKVRLFTLKDSHRPGSDEHDDLQVIESEITRLENIVQEFLRFARPAEPDLLTLPLDGFLREVHALLLPELTKRAVRFELDLSANESVRIDPEKMKQVLLNFIQNAADSIEGEGTVTLRSRRDRQILDGRSLPAVVIEISDTGKGIPTEVQKRLFDPFFTTKEQGTGLGLPIAARIVEKHGGLIQYRTEVGHGTTFSILLPRANA